MGNESRRLAALGIYIYGSVRRNIAFCKHVSEYSTASEAWLGTSKNKDLVRYEYAVYKRAGKLSE